MGGGRPHRPLKPLKQVSPGPQSNLTAGTVALAPAGASQGGLWYRGPPPVDVLPESKELLLPLSPAGMVNGAEG